MRQLLSQYARSLSLCGIVLAALLGVYGFGHQYTFLNTQTDCRALARVIQLALGGHSPYDRALIEGSFESAPFTIDELFYPPSFIPVAAIFVGLGEVPLRMLVGALQVLCFIWIISRATRAVSAQDRGASYAPLLYLCPVAFFALFQTARFGQISCCVCLATLYFWDRWRAGRVGLWGIAALCLASMKPSAVLALFVFLLLEGKVGIVLSVALLHLLSAALASALTSVELSALISGWVDAVAHYRELPQNAVTGSFVYGVSVLVQRMTGFVIMLDFAAIPLAFLVWRARRQLSSHECIALLMVISFTIGSPHAYDFLFLLPALFCVIERGYGVVVYWIVCAMLLIPQRALQVVGVSSFDSILRVLAPLVLLIFLLATRKLVKVAAADIKPLSRGGMEKTNPFGV